MLNIKSTSLNLTKENLMRFRGVFITAPTTKLQQGDVYLDVSGVSNVLYIYYGVTWYPITSA
ncbi:MAG: hypothetical protein RLY43_228 [Bacteroidota bacterium]|jgi:hypothetical protein